jgi:hypothetical protein
MENLMMEVWMQGDDLARVGPPENYSGDPTSENREAVFAYWTQ